MSAQDKYPTLKDEARANVDRIHPLGVQVQAQIMRLYVAPGLRKLEAAGVPDTRCGTCAGREGTVPGGCVQTQADFLKAAMEAVPFMCHAHQDEQGRFTRTCHAWEATQHLTGGQSVVAPWPWSEEAERDAIARAEGGAA